MTAALISTQNLPATNNRTTLKEGIKTSMTQAGITNLVDDYDDPNYHYLVYEVVLAPGKTQGTIYLYIRVSTGLTIYQKFVTDYDPIAKTFSAEGHEFSTAFSSVDIDIWAIAHPEARLLIIRQLTNYRYLGYIRPQNKPAWWDENSYPYCFSPRDSQMEYFYGFHTALSPYNHSASNSNLYYSNYPLRLAYPNPEGKMDLLPAFYLGAPEEKGNAGVFSEDFNYAAAAAMSIGDEIVVTSGTEEYFLFGINTRNGVAIRSV